LSKRPFTFATTRWRTENSTLLWDKSKTQLAMTMLSVVSPGRIGRAGHSPLQQLAGHVSEWRFPPENVIRRAPSPSK
jgi:hypothetical protein